MPYHKKSASSNRRKSYSDIVKRQTVHDVLVKHQSQSSVAGRLRCSVNSLSNWIKRFRHEFESAYSSPAFAPVHAVRTALITAHLLATPPLIPLAIVLGVGAAGLGSFAGYLCHTLERLLYGFLVKESSTGLTIEEDLLGLPI